MGPEVYRKDALIYTENSPLELSSLHDRYTVFPGFCDVHVHLREPGFSYKETIKTGTMAAAHGGYTAVCTMPNLNPVPDSKEHLQVELDIINKDAVIDVYPYASITKGEMGKELSDMEDMKEAIAFSDDGRGVQNEEMMRQAMIRAKSLNKMIVAHCEVNDLLNGGYIHDGEYARINNHKGICSASEYEEVERDCRLSLETGCAFHVCHISCKETVDIIRKYKKMGADVTCEVGPHYLLMDDMMLKDDGYFKMNPPIRSSADKKALIEGIKDGTIDMISTDHAPHSEEEKSRGLKGSAMGIVGLEIAFPVLYTYLVEKGIISLDRLMELMVFNPRKRFGIPLGNSDFTVYDLNEEYEIDNKDFLSMGKATPFLGWKVKGKCMLTVKDGKIAYIDERLKEEYEG
ncbi:MAG: dihydroorotase [Erysipelotrichaceae bacterium]|nr:dihydroorotase [Erysipelotrichaceae bacterium]